MVEPPMSDHPKCKDLVVAHRRWSLTRIEPLGGQWSSKMKSAHIYFMEDNLLHAISKLCHVWFHAMLVKFFAYSIE